MVCVGLFSFKGLSGIFVWVKFMKTSSLLIFGCPFGMFVSVLVSASDWFVVRKTHDKDA